MSGNVLSRLKICTLCNFRLKRCVGALGSRNGCLPFRVSIAMSRANSGHDRRRVGNRATPKTCSFLAGRKANVTIAGSPVSSLGLRMSNSNACRVMKLASGTAVRVCGLRNVHVQSVARNGAVSLHSLAGNVCVTGIGKRAFGITEWCYGWSVRRIHLLSMSKGRSAYLFCGSLLCNFLSCRVRAVHRSVIVFVSPISNQRDRCRSFGHQVFRCPFRGRHQSKETGLRRPWRLYYASGCQFRVQCYQDRQGRYQFAAEKRRGFASKMFVHEVKEGLVGDTRPKGGRYNVISCQWIQST